MDRDEQGQARELWITVKGSHTNRAVLRGLPKRTTLIGRIRGDARLFHPWQGQHADRGRTRRYDARAPTPEQLHQDKIVPWQTAQASAAGKVHAICIKPVTPHSHASRGPPHAKGCAIRRDFAKGNDVRSYAFGGDGNIDGNH
jgi:hypothetical protein